MGRFFWILVGLMGLLLIVLIASGDTGTAFGFESNKFGAAAVSALWAILIGSAVFGRGTGLSAFLLLVGADQHTPDLGTGFWSSPLGYRSG